MLRRVRRNNATFLPQTNRMRTQRVNDARKPKRGKAWALVLLLLGPRLDPAQHGLVPHDRVLRVEAVVVLARQVEHLAGHAAALQR